MYKNDNVPPNYDQNKSSEDSLDILSKMSFLPAMFFFSFG